MLNSNYYRDEANNTHQNNVYRRTNKLGGNINTGYDGDTPSYFGIHINKKRCIYSICEEEENNKGELIDVITGMTFKRYQNIENWKSIDSDKICVKTIEQITSDNVVKILKKLNYFDKVTYTKKLEEFANGLSLGYNEDIIQAKEAIKRRSNNEDYIKTFRLK